MCLSWWGSPTESLTSGTHPEQQQQQLLRAPVPHLLVVTCLCVSQRAACGLHMLPWQQILLYKQGLLLLISLNGVRGTGNVHSIQQGDSAAHAT